MTTDQQQLAADLAALEAQLSDLNTALDVLNQANVTLQKGVSRQVYAKMHTSLAALSGDLTNDKTAVLAAIAALEAQIAADNPPPPPPPVVVNPPPPVIPAASPGVPVVPKPGSPPASPPAHYEHLTPSARTGIYYGPNAAVSFTLGQAGATSWEVRDWDGVIVASGEVASTTLPIPAPAAGWRYGWYQVNLYGPVNDPTLGTSYGSSSFLIIRNNANFPANDPSVVDPSNLCDQPVLAKAICGMGAFRYTISSATNYQSDLADIEKCIAQELAYYLDKDPVRPRYALVEWPNGVSSASDIADVTAVVKALSALTLSIVYEGPSNEPNPSASLATLAQAFYAAVHAGNPKALAGGCAFVTNQLGWTNPGAQWAQAITDECFHGADVITYHGYNAGLGSLPAYRRNFQQFTGLLKAAGLTQPIFDTENLVLIAETYGPFHPRRSRWIMGWSLEGEEFGQPWEQFAYFYPNSHGFWDEPSWWQNGDGSLLPICGLRRTCAEELFGKTFSHKLSFGPVGDAMYWAAEFLDEGDGSSVVAAFATSPIAGGSLSFVSGIDSQVFNVVDSWGNAEQITAVNGVLTVYPQDTPLYIEIPGGMVLTSDTFNGWGNPNAANLVTGHAIDSRLADGIYRMGNAYDGGGDPYTAGAPPCSPTLVTWPTAVSPSRVAVFSGYCWQLQAALTDYDVETSDDGGKTWTVRATITKLPPATIGVVQDSQGTGQTCETWWPESWIDDVALSGGATPINALRLNVRSASYGGEPDAYCSTNQGQGNSPAVVIAQLVAV